LLGPDPDLMPPMPDLPPIQSSARPARPPGGPSSLEPAPALAKQPSPPGGPPSLEAAPAEVPASRPLDTPALPPAAGPEPDGAPAAVDRPIGLDKSTAASKPAPAGLLAVNLPLKPAPPSGQVSPAVTAPATAPSPASHHRDPHVVLTSSGGPEKAPNGTKNAWKEAGRPAARVGDEIITFHDLKFATNENLRKYPELRAALHGGGSRDFNSAERIQARQQVDMLARETLASLIDRSLLVQEAKRHIKDKKMLDRAIEEADKLWRDEEVLPLERQYTVDSEQKLKEKLADEGRSLDAMRQAFERYFLAESYLHDKLRDRIKVELPDLLRYYSEHAKGHEFDRPAQITWRELVVEVEKYKSRAAARQKADDLLAKLRRGADFAKLARAESDGPTSSRKQGGLMQTSPGSYAAKPINLALDSQPIGQVSEVLEGPDSFHILKVENRRPAGPASFEEVQDKIRPILVNQKFREEQASFIGKLKRNALISIYDLGMNDTDKPSP
jgi:peptidyl-prolyl cis-trans isomerase SurA